MVIFHVDCFLLHMQAYTGNSNKKDSLEYVRLEIRELVSRLLGEILIIIR